MVDVRTAQRQLKDRGYYAGPIDGVLGPATENALRAYQRDRGLTVTGRLDSPTVRSLTA
jgi:peptidoglycan hydrolase-like protein with peptidoglycan-binding domain